MKEKCFQYYPLEAKEKTAEEEWDACITAIDSKNRALNRAQKTIKMFPTCRLITLQLLYYSYLNQSN